MRQRTVSLLAAGAALLVVCSGCGNDGRISLSPDEIKLPRCEHVTPTGAEVEVRVEDLETVSPVSCDLAGTTLVFPDGASVTVPSIGGNGGSHQSDTRTAQAYTNLGVYGVVASAVAPGEPRQWWGTPDAVQRAKDAGYGATYELDD